MIQYYPNLPKIILNKPGVLFSAKVHIYMFNYNTVINLEPFLIIKT